MERVKACKCRVRELINGNIKDSRGRGAGVGMVTGYKVRGPWFDTRLGGTR